MNHLTSQKRARLAAGDTKSLLGLNRSIYGDMQMMARGYSGRADVLRTADGRDLRELGPCGSTREPCGFAWSVCAANGHPGS